MLISKTHTEPTNEELGIKPVSKAISWPLACLVGLAIWAGIIAI